VRGVSDESMDCGAELAERGKGQEVELLLTFRSIQTWALEEARRRLEAEGILPDPDAKKE
jgi:hypothetical protein